MSDTNDAPVMDATSPEADAGATPDKATAEPTIDDLKAENARIADALKKANKEAETRRKRLDEIEKAEAAKADAEKSELQKAQERAEAAEKRLQSVTVNRAVTEAASDPKLQARDPKAIAALVRTEALEIDGDDVKGIDAELKRLKAAHPALFFSSTADGGAQGESNAPTDMNSMIRSALRR